MIKNGNFEEYWKKISKLDANISDEFKDIVFKMFAYKPDERPTLEELRVHPWMEQ